MNIVFLSVLFRHPNRGEKVGGGEISNRRLLEALSNTHQVTIVSATGNGLWGEKINGVTYFDFSANSKLGVLPAKLSRLLSKILYRYSASKILQTLRPDIILCSTLEFNAALRYANANKVPVGGFIRAFENFVEYNAPSFLGSIKRLLRSTLYGNTQNKAINKLDFLLPNSDFMEEKCKSAFLTPSRYVIYPPIDSVDQSTMPSKPTHYCKIGSVVMVSGAKKKGGDLFIELSRRFPELEFSIIGYRGTHSNLEKPNNLQLLGWVEHPEALISQADLVLVPSIWEEPFGRIAVEALQCGTPVLVSKIGGLPEAVGYREYLMLEPNCITSWQNRIKECVMSSKELIDECSIAMRNTQKYTMAQQLIRLEMAMLTEIDKKVTAQ